MLKVTDLRKTFKVSGSGDDVHALDGVSLSVEPGEFFTLLGPSGCGKTTTLRSIAGLESPDSGEIRVGDQTLYSSEKRIEVPANKRGLGMVFQSYAIWPHMNVAANVAFPLKSRSRATRLSRAEIDRKVDEALEKVEMSHAKKRPATDLSGGQQQRLALARALVTESPLTLFDEPLSNLDAKLRDVMRFEMKRLQRELGITAVYVTHDQVEALAMSNRIAIMQAGRIEQLGRPRDIYETPASLFVADFIGTSNFLKATVKSVEPNGTYLVATEVGELLAELPGQRTVSPGSSVTVAVRPQDIHIEEAGAAGTEVGRWVGVVRTRAYFGEGVDHLVDVGGTEIRVRVNPRISHAPETKVVLRFDAGTCTLLPEG